jgi:hypothetical protein
MATRSKKSSAVQAESQSIADLLSAPAETATEEVTVVTAFFGDSNAQ